MVNGNVAHAATPTANVIAVETPAYISDFPVSFSKHSFGIFANTCAMEGNSFSFAFNARPCKPENNCVCLEPSYKSACWTYSSSNVFDAAATDDDDGIVVVNTLLAPLLTKAFFGNCVVVFLKQQHRECVVDAIDVSAYISSFVCSQRTNNNVPQTLLLSKEEDKQRERVILSKEQKKDF